MVLGKTGAMDLMLVMGPTLALHGVRMNQSLILHQTLETLVDLLQGNVFMVIVSCVGLIIIINNA
jgi:hypothetical protein